MEGLGDPLIVARPRVQVSFHRKGPWLLGVAHLQGPGAPIVLTARANVHDLEHVARALVMQRIQRAAAVGSLFGSIEHAFSSAAHQAETVAKGKVARELFGQVRKVMKSPVASAALAATSIVFPPVGIPATAAFVTANKVLDNVEAGGAAAERARKQIQALGKLARQPGPVGAKARKVARILSVTDRWRQGLKDAQAHASAPLAALADAQTRHVNGRVALPGGRFAQLHGVQRAGHIDATLTLPSGKRVPLRATVQGECGC